MEASTEFSVDILELRKKLKRRGQRSKLYPRGKLGYAMSREAAKILGCHHSRVPMPSEAQILRWEQGKHTPSIMWQVVLERIDEQATALAEKRAKLKK